MFLRRKIAVAALICFLLSSVVPSAANAAFRCTPGPNKNLKACNYTGRNLSGANLSGSDLTGANLTGATLTGANLTGTKLTKSNLCGVRSGGIVGQPANLTANWILTVFKLEGCRVHYRKVARLLRATW